MGRPRTVTPTDAELDRLATPTPAPIIDGCVFCGRGDAIQVRDRRGAIEPRIAVSIHDGLYPATMTIGGYHIAIYYCPICGRDLAPKRQYPALTQ